MLDIASVPIFGIARSIGRKSRIPFYAARSFLYKYENWYVAVFNGLDGIMDSPYYFLEKYLLDSIRNNIVYSIFLCLGNNGN